MNDDKVHLPRVPTHPAIPKEVPGRTSLLRIGPRPENLTKAETEVLTDEKRRLIEQRGECLNKYGCKMVIDDFCWYPSGTRAGDHLRCGTNGIDYARVVPTGPHDEWLAIVNLHRPISERRSATFGSEAAAKAGVRQWLCGALASFQ